MVTHGESSSSNTHSVFVETNFDTRFALPVNYNEKISGFKEKVCKEHKKIFPEVGEIKILALKVKCRRQFFYLSDSMETISMAFEGISNKWFMYVDVVKVEKKDLPAIMDVGITCSNLELLEKKATRSDSVLADGDTEYLTLEGGLKTKVKKTRKKKRKRKIESQDERSRKKCAIQSKSAVSATASPDDSHEKCGKVQVEVVASDILAGAMGKDIERSEKNDTSMEENQQTSEVDRLCQEKIPSVNVELINGRSGSDVNDVEANQALETDLGMRESNGSDENHKSNREEVPIEQPDDLQVAEEQDLEKGEETAKIVNTNQDKDLVPNLDTSRDDAKEYQENKNERDEGSRLAPSAAANLQTAELVTYPENQLVDSSDLTTYPATEKKKKRKKLSNCATHLLDVMQKENEMGEKSGKVMGKDQIETDNVASHMEHHLDATTGLITSPVTEKKRRKKSSKDHNNQSSATATISKETESQKENEIGEKIDDKVGSGKAIPIVAANIQTNSFGTYPENELEANRGFETGPATKKKKKQKKFSKDKIKQSTSTTEIPIEIVNETKKTSESIDPIDATSKSLPNSKGESLADTLVDTIQNEKDIGDKFLDNVGPTENPQVSRGESLADTLVDTIQDEKDIGDRFLDNVEPTDSLQVSDLARKPVHESETLNHTGKLATENRTTEQEAAKDSVELSADETKSVKSSKKKKSRKAKSSSKEDSLFASDAQNVEPIIKVVHEEEPDNLIRSVLDSLQQKNETEERLGKIEKKETEESLGKIEKKSSKKQKKKDALNIEEAQLASVVVKNSAQEEVPLISNPKYIDASFTPVKKDTETHLKKSIDVAGNTEETNLSKQIQTEKADMVDNFDSSQKDDFIGGGKKQDQVTSGVKPSKKEKKNLNLYPSGSIDGLLSPTKPKEKRGRVQPTRSCTSQLQSRVNNDHSGSKVDHSATPKKVTVKNKKEAAKKIPNPVTVKKSSSMNFFKDVEWDSTDDEAFKRASNVSTKTASDSSSDNDSDVTSMSRRQANNLPGGTTKGSLQEILRSSRRYKEAKLRASQSQPDTDDDESPRVDFVPDSQAN